MEEGVQMVHKNRNKATVPSLPVPIVWECVIRPKPATMNKSKKKGYCQMSRESAVEAGRSTVEAPLLFDQQGVSSTPRIPMVKYTALDILEEVVEWNQDVAGHSGDVPRLDAKPDMLRYKSEDGQKSRSKLKSPLSKSPRGPTKRMGSLDSIITSSTTSTEVNCNGIEHNADINKVKRHQEYSPSDTPSLETSLNDRLRCASECSTSPAGSVSITLEKTTASSVGLIMGTKELRRNIGTELESLLQIP